MHKELTGHIIFFLPSWQKKILGRAGENFLLESSLFPDLYFDVRGDGYSRAKPYAYFIDGIQFHYLPNTPVENEYKYWTVVTKNQKTPLRLKRLNCYQSNPAWEHCWKGFNFYFSQAVKSLQSKQIKDFAGFLGSFLHVLQDATSYLHSLEGIDGTDIFVLDRLLVSEEDDFSLWPTSLLGEKSEGRIKLKAPRLLGTSISEASFLLYSELYQAQAANRRLLIPLYYALKNGNKEKERQIRSCLLSRTAQLCLNVAHTIFCLAFQRWSSKEEKKLRKIYLSDLKPVWQPRLLSLPYRFIAMVRDKSLNEKRQKCPLKLCLNDSGKWKAVVFKKGLGTGSHYHHSLIYQVPAGIYKFFSGAVGLHADLGHGGDLKVRIYLNRRLVFRQHFTDYYPGQRFQINIRNGGLLQLAVQSNQATAATGNQIVWGEPVLLK